MLVESFVLQFLAHGVPNCGLDREKTQKKDGIVRNLAVVPVALECH